MKAIKVAPNKRAEVVEIDEGLEALQNAVGGYIEVVYPFDDNVALVCNEEGKIDGESLPNRALYYDDDMVHMYDIVYGTFLVLGLDAENFRSLTEDEESKFLKRFYRREVFLNIGGQIVAIRE